MTYSVQCSPPPVNRRPIASAAKHIASHATKAIVDDAVENEVDGEVDEIQTVCDDGSRLVDEVRVFRLERGHTAVADDVEKKQQS